MTDYPILVDGYGRQFVKVPVEDFVKLELRAAAAPPDSQREAPRQPSWKMSHTIIRPCLMPTACGESGFYCSNASREAAAAPEPPRPDRPRIYEMSDDRWADYLQGFNAGYDVAEKQAAAPPEPPRPDWDVEQAWKRLENDLAFAAPEMWMVHVRRRWAEAAAAFRPDYDDENLTEPPSPAIWAGLPATHALAGDDRQGQPLDVERLGRALDRIRDRGMSTSLDPVEIAVEYARLRESGSPGDDR